MTTNMKGLLKGLRYISQIFDEKEPEFQIGYPTDVKHVAHIGSDGPATNAPSWMVGFQSAPEISSQLNIADVKKVSSEEQKHATLTIAMFFLAYIDINLTGATTQDSQPASTRDKLKYKSRRKPVTDIGSPLSSPKRSSDAPKPSRRHRSSNNSTESLPEDSSGNGRRHRKSNHGIESPSLDQPAIPKHSHRRRSKESYGDGLTKPSRSKGKNSTEKFPDIG
ncbi:PBD domain-containing protein, partial [Cephalotus follicularis]